MSTVQINARLSSKIKSEGDATLAKFGLSATEAIRSLWEYLGTTKDLPDFIKRNTNTCTKVTPSSIHVNDGAGMALRMAGEHGLAVTDVQNMSYQELRDLAFDELVEEGRAHV